MAEENKNINFLDNDGIFYNFAVMWLRLNDEQQQQVKIFILNHFDIKSRLDGGAPYYLGGTQNDSRIFLSEINNYDYINPIKTKLLNLFDELGLEFPECFYDADLNYDVGAYDREQVEFFLMHLFLSMVREYFIVLSKENVSFRDIFDEPKPKNLIGWLLYPIGILISPISYLIIRHHADVENNPQRIAKNKYRVEKVIRDVEKEINKMESQKREKQRAEDAKREKQQYLSGLISSINDL